MSRIERLKNNYENYIAIPWRDDVAPAQRVIFCIYRETEELRFRAKIDEFELATGRVGHDWAVFDLTDTFAEWLSSHRYAEKYYAKPHQLAIPIKPYLQHIINGFTTFQNEAKIDKNTVIALKGVGSLFGLLKVKMVIDALLPLVTGRLLVFFPGNYENNNYRLFDAYDGWNYLAVPITAD